MDAGILPVKRLADAKKRLSERFGDEHRVEIARALVHDALELCRSSSAFLTWWVVSDDHDVLDLALSYGCRPLPDSAHSLNGALALATQAAMAEGASSVTIVPADVPLAYSGDLRDVVDTGATSDIVVVPSERDGGTNGLFMKLPNKMEPRFGPSSLSAHTLLAERLGLRCSVLVLPRLALDIDTAEDAERFLVKDELRLSKTGQLLRSLTESDEPTPT